MIPTGTHSTELEWGEALAQEALVVFDFSGFQGQNGQGFEFDINDIFQNFGFGGGQQARRGRDVSIDINLTFHESIFGVTRKLLITKNNTCTHCDGSGAKKGTDTESCNTCGGQGKYEKTATALWVALLPYVNVLPATVPAKFQKKNVVIVLELE